MSETKNATPPCQSSNHDALLDEYYKDTFYFGECDAQMVTDEVKIVLVGDMKLGFFRIDVSSGDTDGTQTAAFAKDAERFLKAYLADNTKRLLVQGGTDLIVGQNIWVSAPPNAISEEGVNLGEAVIDLGADRAGSLEHLRLAWDMQISTHPVSASDDASVWRAILCPVVVDAWNYVS